jgi:hypothetical protein
LHEDNGHRFGNFPNYYSFHSVEERIDLLTPELITSMASNALHPDQRIFTACDIGSNDGTLTRDLHDKITSALDKSAGKPWAVHTLGLELDEALVERAKESKSVLSSTSRLAFEAVDVADPFQLDQSVNSFFGEISGSGAPRRFDLVTVFSTTMWVHVNCGDAVFVGFLQHLAKLAVHLVIEPQPWRCYRQAATRLRRQHRPGLACFDAVANGQSDKLVEDLIERTITGVRSDKPSPPFLGAVDTVLECGDRGLGPEKTQSLKKEPDGPTAVEPKDEDLMGASQFDCVCLSSAAGSWKRKVLLFTSKT